MVPVIDPDSPLAQKIKSAVTPKHKGGISVVNYKGGVGKTTISCLLGYYLARETGKNVLLIDIDPQCSLSLSLGLDPDLITKSSKNTFYLFAPEAWNNISPKDLYSCIVSPNDQAAPKNLYALPGSFEADDLDFKIIREILKFKGKTLDTFFGHCKGLLSLLHDVDYIIIDCPPNKMFLTQAMLRASCYYLAVTIPDRISIYGMPRLLRWVDEIPQADRPKCLGYVANAVNRTGGGKVTSQVSAEWTLRQNVRTSFEGIEREVLDKNPSLGDMPRLDAVSRFLSGEKYIRFEFAKRTSGQPSIEECVLKIVEAVRFRMEKYSEKS